MHRRCLQREARLLAARSPSVDIKSQAAASRETAACNGLMDREGSIRCNIVSWLHGNDDGICPITGSDRE